MAKSQPLVCSGHSRPVTSLAFSHLASDGHYLILSGCKDGKPMLRDGITGDWIGTFLGHKGAVWDARLSADGGKAVTGSADFTAKVWETYTGSCLATLPHQHIVRSVDIAAKGNHVVTAGYERKLRLYNLDRPETPDVLLKEGASLSHDNPKAKAINCVVYDEENHQIISSDDAATLMYWDTRTLAPTFEKTYQDPIKSMTRNHDGSIITLAVGKQVTFMNPDRSEIVKHNLDYVPITASLHPITREKFVTGAEDGWVRIHSAETGELLETKQGHHGPVHAISFSGDGELFGSGSEDGTVRLWQTSPKAYGLWQPLQ